MSLSQITLTRSSVVLLQGNSNVDPAFGNQVLRWLEEEALAHYAPGGVRLQTPIFRNQALSGATLGTVDAAIGTNLLENPYTHVAMDIGINNYNVARATSRASFVSILNKCAGLQVLVLGPYARGEMYPTGQNTGTGTGDTTIDNLAADMGVIVNGGTTTDAATYPGYSNVCYRDLRSTLFVVTMPPLNLPAPGASSGTFTNVESPVGLHFNPRGKAAVRALCASSVAYG